jgi:hypothetical protein
MESLCRASRTSVGKVRFRPTTDIAGLGSKGLISEADPNEREVEFEVFLCERMPVFIEFIQQIGVGIRKERRISTL